MAHKTITISEEAYNALKRLKNGRESFTDVILKLAKKRKKNLLEVIENIEWNEDEISALDEVLKERKGIVIKKVEL
ncbi:MAG: antitoxin VapB family protein [Candidatus Methanofastidiosia archaeon]